jgi:beta-lactamase class A
MTCSDAQLHNALAKVDREFSGQIGVAAYELARGISIAYNAHHRFPTASTIKLPIAVEGFRQLSRGEQQRDQKMVLRNAEKQAGTGVLGELDDGLQLTFMDLLRLMTVVSDNTATNMLIAALGMDRVNATLRELGITDMELLRPVTFELQDGRIPNIGLGTPAGFVVLLRRIATYEALPPPLADELIDIMRRQQHREFLARYLPSHDGVWVADKVGMLPGIRNDVGIVGRDKPEYVVAVMSEGCADPSVGVDNEGTVAVARISRLIFDCFSEG